MRSHTKKLQGWDWDGARGWRDADSDSFPQAGDSSADTTVALNAPALAGTIPQLATYLLSGFWQYNGEIAHHWASNTITYNINGLNAAEKALAQSAFNAWHEVANLTFVQVSGSANITFNHNGSLTAFETDNFNSAGVMSSATVDISADWITTDGGAKDGKTGIDSYGYQTYIHEIGHALGLGHQGPYNGSANYSTDASYANDTWQYSVMSYFPESDYNGGSYRYVITPQMADIYAVQQVYGAASTRTGDTTYGFHNTAGSIFDFSAYTQAPAFTIYDAGGTDTLDASGYSNAQTIDLHPGAFSSIGGLVHNIGISTTTVIEIAIGGTGNDTLIASDTGSTLNGGAGNDTLVGGAGADRLIGGAGVDTLTGGSGADVFALFVGDSSPTAGSHDLITDFTVGTDKIDLTGLDGDTSTPGIIDAFRFLVTAAFDGLADELDYFFDAVRGVTVLQGDVNGDKSADFAVDLAGNHILTSADFTSGSLRVVSPLTLTGDGNANTLVGDVLDDHLYGLGGNDTLIGNAGNDYLDGGTGADAMSGGAGDDTYVVDNVGDVVTEGPSVSPFTVPSGWTVKGTADFNGDGQTDVVVNSTSDPTQNQIWLLSNGAVSSVKQMPAFVSGWLLQGIADVNGDGTEDLVYTNPAWAKQYVLYLNAGTLTEKTEGFAPAPVTVDAVGPLTSTDGSGGIDTVLSSISYTLSSGVENLTLVPGAGNINGTGNALDNIIVGNEGNNILTGGVGVDTLTGGSGADIFVFSNGDSGSTLGHRDSITDFTPGTDLLDLNGIDADTTASGQDAFRFLGAAAFDGAPAALHTSYDASHNVTVLEGDVNGDKVADFGIELSGSLTLSPSSFVPGSLLLPLTLTGTAGSDTLTGGKMNDTLYGLGGNDTLIGNAGNDYLDGGTGADAMSGGAGDDTYVVDNVGDVVTEGPSVSPFTVPSGWTVKGTADFNGDGQTDVVVNSTSDPTQNQIWLLSNGAVSSVKQMPAFVSGWLLQGIADVNGDGTEDLVYTNPAWAKQYVLYLNAGTLTEKTEGFAPAPVTVDAVGPLTSTDGSGGIDTVLSSISYTLSSGVENLTLVPGAGNINGTGNALDNIIVGNEGNNILTGGVGVDTLTGGSGADIFVFSNGDSGSTLGHRDSITDFTPGTDLLDLNGIDADTTASGQDAFRFLGAAAFDGAPAALHTSYDASHNVTVLEGDVNGDKVADFGIELSGSLTLSPSSFVPGSLLLPLTLTGTAGSDTLTGGKMNDTLYGLGGNDTLIGNAGNDYLDGGTGADAMSGGAGDDTYVVDNVGDVVTEGPSVSPFTVPSGWTVKGTADFNGDGQTDVVVNSTSDPTQNQIWLLSNGAVSSVKQMPAFVSGWLLQGIADVNGDGTEDLVYTNPAWAKQYVLYLNAGTLTEKTEGFAPAPVTVDAVGPLTSTDGSGGIDTVLSSISYTLSSGVENLTLVPGAGNINGTGNALDNIIVGNEGNNILTGGVGVDTLTGGSGADIFVFSNGDSGSTLGHRDSITDFTPGTDLLDLNGIDADTTASGQDAFRFLGAAAFDGAPAALHTSYDASHNVTVLEGDVNGDKVADFGIELSGSLTLSPSSFVPGSLLLPLTLTGTAGSDTLTGGKMNDTLYGLGGNDTLIGNAGNDYLDGGTGADAMSGGAGDDTYVVDNVGDVVTEGPSVSPFTVPSGWTVKGTADFNGDGQTDVVVNSTSDPTQNQIWLLSNGAVSSVKQMPAFVSGWLLQGIADVNGDGTEDLVYTNPAWAKQYVLYLNAGTLTEKTEGFAPAPVTVDAVGPLTSTDGSGGIDTVLSSISYTLSSGVENLTLVPGAGNINGTGNALDNIIVGNEGNNILTGGVGVDTLTGGSGADIFVFSNGDSGSTLGHRDSITDFTPGTDLLDLNGIDADTTASGQDAFRFLGAAAFDGAPAALHTSYDASHNVTVLEGDVNGDKVADFGIELSGSLTLSPSSFVPGSLLLPLTLTGTAGSDTLTGGKMNDTLYGLGGNDTLIGNAGNDYLDGGTGADAMSGGAGDDTYVVDNVGDVVTEGPSVSPFTVPSGWTVKGTADFNGDGQTDVVVNSTSDPTQNQIWLLSNGAVSSVKQMPAFVSGWLLQGIADVNGDGTEDLVYTNPAWAKQYVLYLNAGTLTEKTEGFAPAPVTVDAVGPLTSTDGSGGIDTVLSSISYTLSSGVENLTLVPGAGNINGTGNALDNIIVGNEGNNILTGGVGVDTLTGGSGADIFVFSNGDSGSTLGHRDSITDFTPGTDLLDLNGIDADTTASGQDAFRFLGAAAFDGAPAALHTSYDASHNVTVLEGDVNGDKVADFGIELSGSLTLSPSSFVPGSLLLPLTLTGTAGSDTLTGGKMNDTLYGLGGNDTLIGNAGNDYLDGGTGADAMSGGAGDDTYVVDNVGDVVTEGPSVSPFTVPSGWTVKGTADFNGDGQTDVVVNSTSDPTQNQIWLLSNGAVSSVKQMPAFVSGWLLQGIADVNGDGTEDLVYTNPAWAKQYVLYLNAGTLTEKTEGFAPAPVTVDAVGPLTSTDGSGGIDTVLSSISYTLSSGVENLTLVPGAGNINGTGNALDNIIVGNEGNNILTGGVGMDTFVFKPNFGQDTITDFVPGIDTLQFDHTIFANAADVIAHTADDGHGSAVITADAGNAVTLQHVALAAVHQSDFHII